MLEGEHSSVCDGIDDFMADLTNQEASYTIIGPMGFVSELGVVSQQEAIDMAKAESKKQHGVRLYVRSEMFGALPVPIQ